LNAITVAAPSISRTNSLASSSVMLRRFASSSSLSFVWIIGYFASWKMFEPRKLSPPSIEL
jgi:hypothetical protein